MRAPCLHLEIRGEREAGRQYWHEHPEGVGVRRRRRQQRRHRVLTECPVSRRRLGIFRNSTGIRMDRPEKTAGRKCLRAIATATFVEC